MLVTGSAALVAGLVVVPLPPLLVIPAFLLAQATIATLGYLAYEDRVLGRDTDSGGQAASAIIWIWFLVSLGLGGIYSAVAAEPFLWRGVSPGVAILSDLFGLVAIWTFLNHQSERRRQRPNQPLSENDLFRR